ncbi:MAG: AAA family ATPase, partial [Pseudomonadota bacterium]
PVWRADWVRGRQQSRTQEAFEKKEDDKPPTKGQLRNYRASLVSSSRHELAAGLNKEVFGLDYLTEAMEADLSAFLDAPRLEKPMFATIAGFPGNAKTALVMMAGKLLGLPVIKMNLQEYAANSQAAADRFGEDLFNKIQKALQTSESKKYILLIEEMDKAYEINPADGKPVERPVMAYIKDLLNEGQRTITVTHPFAGKEYRDLDIRGGMTYITMNFGVEIFNNIYADPRMTTVDDMIGNWRKLVQSTEATRKMLMKLFKPETVNRLLAKRFYIARPPREPDYRKIIERELQAVQEQLFFDPASKKNLAGIRVTATDAYLEQFMMKEAVIPSEGGRQAAVTSHDSFKADILKAIKGIPANSALDGSPIEIILDYNPRSSDQPDAEIVAYAQLDSEGLDAEEVSATKTEISRYSPKLRFPSIEAFGDMTMKRIYVSGHEFGHAMGFVLMGNRFEYMIGVQPMPGAEGLVKPRHVNSMNSSYLIADLAGTMASRAMERIMMAEDPTAPESAVHTSQGASSDIKQSTEALWSLIYQLGLDPSGGVIDRKGLGGCKNDDHDTRRVFFCELPNDKVEQMALVLRDVEDYMVHLFLQAHPQDWYRDMIVEFAKRGSMTEAEMYELIEYPFPGENGHFVGETIQPQIGLGEGAKGLPESVKASVDHIQGETGRTASQNLDLFTKFLLDSIGKRMHEQPGNMSVEASELGGILSGAAGASCSEELGN